MIFLVKLKNPFFFWIAPSSDEGSFILIKSFSSTLFDFVLGAGLATIFFGLGFGLGAGLATIFFGLGFGLGAGLATIFFGLGFFVTNFFKNSNI